MMIVESMCGIEKHHVLVHLIIHHVSIKKTKIIHHVSRTIILNSLIVMLREWV